MLDEFRAGQSMMNPLRNTSAESAHALDQINEFRGLQWDRYRLQRLEIVSSEIGKKRVIA